MDKGNYQENDYEAFLEKGENPRYLKELLEVVTDPELIIRSKAKVNEQYEIIYHLSLSIIYDQFHKTRVFVSEKGKNSFINALVEKLNYLSQFQDPYTKKEMESSLLKILK